MPGCWCCHGDALTHDEHLAAEAELVEFGLDWWHSTRPNHDGARVTSAATDVPLTSVSAAPCIHTLEYTSGTPESGAPALVMIHGFGFGAALYYAAAPPLATEWPGRVFSIDQLGCGLSSRPPWPYPRGHRCPVSVAEAYFVDAIEAWRAALSLDTIVLLGHSIGGYIAAAYAERHPERVRQLVLASPAGVPHPPEGLAEVHAKAPRVLKLVRSLVRRGWSPMLLTRDLGMGRRLLTNYMSRRFGDEQPWIAKPLLLNYLLGIWCRSPKSAGGYMVQALMAVGGIPKGLRVSSSTRAIPSPRGSSRSSSSCHVSRSSMESLIGLTGAMAPTWPVRSRRSRGAPWRARPSMCGGWRRAHIST